MSKDVIIAGALAVGCVALIAAAFLLPKSKPADETAKTDVVTTETLPADPLAAPLPPLGAEAGTAAFTSTGPGLPAATGLPTGPAPLGSTGFPTTSTLPSTTPGLPSVSTLPAQPGAFPSAPADPFGAPVSGTGLGATLPAPAPVVEPVAAPAPEARTHTVANGELLGDIALKYYGTSKAWRKIAAANPGTDPKHLKVGQKLVIPADDKSTSAPASATAGAGERTYTVKAGDTYYSIAKRELGSAGRWKEIKALNGKSGNDLRVGSVIKLPSDGSSSAASAASAPGATAGSDATTHTVAKGETLADIARKRLGSSKQWKRIVEANPGISPENLKIGQKLVIPGGAANSAAPAAGAAEVSTGDYVVQPGDTPRTIALKVLGSKNKAQAIIDANPGINPNNLRVGQKLKIPGAPASAPSALPAPAPAAAFPAMPATPAPMGGATAFPAAPATSFPTTPAAGPGADQVNPFQPAPADFSSPYATPSQPSPFTEPAR